MPARKFVIGDIHGCYKTFKKLIFDILCITKEDTLYLLGDYIDRGPASRKVIKLILKLQAEQYNIRPLIGNHEIMLLGSLYTQDKFEGWMRSGGRATLDSFKVNHPKEIKEKYLSFIISLPYYYKLDNFIIVHGGLNFNIENPLNDFESMAWVRNNEIKKDKIGDRRIIVGHTPSSLPRIYQSLNEDRILLDGGCVFKNASTELGNLVALELETLTLYHTECIDFN